MRTAIGGVGRVLVTVGVLILLFVAYQLWGTGIYEARAQSDLESQFKRELAERGRTTSTTSPGASTSTSSPTTTPGVELPPVPADGDPVGEIKIDKIGVDKIVVEGTTVPDLRKGPGHYAGSPMPGQTGNAAIAGHRTTYGAPFGNLDQLSRGDRITVRTLTGTWEYVLTDDPFAVKPTQTEVLDAGVDPATGKEAATLTLTTCEPKYSASQRLVVKAQLSQPQTPLPGTGQARVIAGLSGGTESSVPVYLTGLIAAVIGGLWWFLFHRYPRWTTWLAGVIPFLVALFVFYTYLERVLPNNY
ncbi:MAG TPA: class E sortase [Acidimicrobiia bacterium]|nr:class E sortase [Acidimicrobiia bacterium]